MTEGATQPGVIGGMEKESNKGGRVVDWLSAQQNELRVSLG